MPVGYKSPAAPAGFKFEFNLSYCIVLIKVILAIVNDCLVQFLFNTTKNMDKVPTTSASLGSLLELQNLRTHPRLAESESPL